MNSSLKCIRKALKPTLSQMQHLFLHMVSTFILTKLSLLPMSMYFLSHQKAPATSCAEHTRKEPAYQNYLPSIKTIPAKHGRLPLLMQKELGQHVQGYLKPPSRKKQNLTYSANKQYFAAG